MDSSNRRTVRVLWGYFSDTIPSLIPSRQEFDSACRKKNIEVIHWCHGEKTDQTLHYFFPMRYAHKVSTGHSEWTKRYEDRLPTLEDPESVLSYVIDHFNLLCQSFQPDIFISWNRHDPIFGLPHELATNQGLTVFDMERALIPQWVSMGLEFKRSGKNFSQGSVAKGRRILDQFPSAHIRKQSRPRLTPSKRSGKTVLVLGSWDAVTDRSVNCYSDSYQIASSLARDLPDWHVVFKPHPLVPANKTSETNLEISTADPTKLIANSDVVVTSGTKLELDVIQSGKPLVLCGGGFLASCGAARVTSNHDSTVKAINTVNHWHRPEESMEDLAAFVGHEADHSWYALSNAEGDAGSLDNLLENFLEVKSGQTNRPDLQACMLNYHSAFVNRYHRSGIGDFGNRELLSELMKRVKLKLSHGL